MPAPLRDQLLATREQKNYDTRRTKGAISFQLRQGYACNSREPFQGSGQGGPVPNVNEIETGIELAESSFYGTPAGIPNGFPTEFPDRLEEKGVGARSLSNLDESSRSPLRTKTAILEVPSHWPEPSTEVDVKNITDAVFFVKYRKYKVSVSFGCSQAAMVPTAGVLDNGAGPNLIHAKVLTPH